MSGGTQPRDMATDADATTITIRSDADGGVVAVDEETDTSIEGERESFVGLALLLKLEGRETLATEVAAATSPTELVDVLAAESSPGEESVPVASGDRGESEEKPDPSAIRGIVESDKTPEQLVAEARQKDADRERRLTDGQ